MRSSFIHSFIPSFILLLQAAAKKGLLDVVTKLVELGADWPHGKIAAVTGNDVVQLLVENYKGAKKLQVCWFLGRGSCCCVMCGQLARWAGLAVLLRCWLGGGVLFKDPCCNGRC
jgi:hypothetical protein